MSKVESQTQGATRPFYLPPWRIEITVRGGVTKLTSQAILARLAADALIVAGAPSPASLALILSDDRELEALNDRHMGHDGPTDVLSFPLLPPSAFPGHLGKGSDSAAGQQIEPAFQSPPRQRIHLGDIVISVERAIAQEPTSPAEELRELVVHGVLHICGWDHAQTVERNAMRALEKEILGHR